MAAGQSTWAFFRTAFLGAAACLSAFAETPDLSQLGRLNSGSVESSFQVPAPPTLTPSQPAPPTNDRAKSSAAAVALALGAAAQQRVMCYMMMAEAMKQQDSTDKAMMMAMANQACAQAAETEANAFKNKEGQKLVSQNDIPKQASLQFQSAQFGKDKVKEAEIPRITFNDEAEKRAVSDDPLLAAAAPAIPDLNQVFNRPPPSEDLKDPLDQFTVPPPEEPVTPLDPINGTSIQFDDKAKTPGNPQVGPQMAAFGFGTTGGPGKGTPEDRALAKTVPDYDGEPVDGANRKTKDRTTSAGTGSGGESGGSGGASSGLDFAALMEQLTGGAGGGEGPSGPALELVELPKAKRKEDTPNIFQYAAWRYRKLANEQGAVRLKKGNGIRVPSASTMAQTGRRKPKRHDTTLASYAKVSTTSTAAAQKIDTAPPPSP